MSNELVEYLNALDSGESYRVDAVLKETPHEITERVFFIGANGEERGPFVRKRFDADSKMGSAYERIFAEQSAGRRFLHIPRIFECVRNDSTLTVLMEIVPGKTIVELVEEQGASLDLARKVFPTLCDAVIELHESFDPPLIHRDITPSNVIVSSGYVTLVDFGIARTFDEGAERDTTSFGTRSYAPPEQFGYAQTDARSDIYALGMLLYYLLTGENPNPSLAVEGFSKTGVPAPLQELLSKASAFSPDARFANAHALKTAFAITVSNMSGAPEEKGHSIPHSPPEAPSAHPKGGETQRVGASSPLQIPRWAGITWNVALVVIWAFFAIAAMSVAFFPDGSAAQLPLSARLVMCFGIFVVAGGFLSYALLDKRRLGKRLGKRLARDWKRETIVCLGIALAVAVISAFLGSLLGMHSPI